MTDEDILKEVIEREFGHLFIKGDAVKIFLDNCDDEEPCFYLRNLKLAISLTREEIQQKVFEEIKNLKKRILMNGNLSHRLVEVEEGEFEYKHDKILNNIVVEVIEESEQSLQNIFNSNSQEVKKDGSDGSNENLLEERSITGEDNKDEHMPVSADNQLSADNGDSPKPRFATDSGESLDVQTNCPLGETAPDFDKSHDAQKGCGKRFIKDIKGCEVTSTCGKTYDGFGLMLCKSCQERFKLKDAQEDRINDSLPKN